MIRRNQSCNCTPTLMALFAKLDAAIIAVESAMQGILAGPAA